MNEEDLIEIEKIDKGLALANERMLKEKALRGESIVVYDPDKGAIVKIKAVDLIPKGV